MPLILFRRYRFQTQSALFHQAQISQHKFIPCLSQFLFCLGTSRGCECRIQANRFFLYKISDSLSILSSDISYFIGSISDCLIPSHTEIRIAKKKMQNKIFSFFIALKQISQEFYANLFLLSAIPL